MNDPELESETREFVQERIDAGDMPAEIRRKSQERGYEGHLVEKLLQQKFSIVPEEF